VPSRRTFQIVAAGFIACVVLGIWLLFASPRLPGESAGNSAVPSSGGAPAPSIGPGIFITVSPTPSATPVATRPYTVQPGDTVASIASAIGVPASTIVQLNPTISPNNLQIGQTLRLPISPAP
jgi:LysM repeat protein